MDIEKIEDIKSKLKEKGYTKKLISYEKLKELYQEYGANMEEKIFARQVLEIDDRNYNNAKNKGTRVTIFKGREEITEGEIQQIQKSLIEQGYAGKSIDCEELKALYQEYGVGMQEKTFVEQVLGIKWGTYKNVKCRNIRARILKGKEEITEEKIDGIQQKLIEQGYAGKSINYEEVKELYQEYGSGMQEKTFVEQVLEISNGNYKNAKNKGTRARILKGKEEIKEGKIEQIQQNLIEQGYAGKSIDYEELKELYQQYGAGMQEKTFVEQVLEISNSNYQNVKYSGTRVRILKGRENITEEEIEQIKQKLIEQGYMWKAIDYEELKKLYQQYGSSMQEKTFVQQVLEINLNTYEYAKYRGTRVRILKGREKITEEEIDETYQNLIDQGLICKSIDCEEVKELYKKYGAGTQEKVFVEQVLGIKWQTYKNAKCGNRRVKILKGKLQEKILGYENTEDAVLPKVNENVEIAEEEEISLDEKCVQELKRQIEIGVSREEALKNVSEQLGLGQEEMLNAMQTYLMTKGRVEVSRRGKKVYLKGAMDEEGR